MKKKSPVFKVITIKAFEKAIASGKDPFGFAKRVVGPQSLGSILWPLSPRISDQLKGFGGNAYSSHPWVHLACQSQARNINAVPMRIWKGSGPLALDEDTPEIVTSGPWVDLIESPTPFMPRPAWIEVCVSILDHTGDLAFLKTKRDGLPITSEKEIPGALYPFNGRKFVYRMDDAEERVIGWKSDGEIMGRKEWQLWEIARVWHPNPDAPTQGIGVQEASDKITRSDYKSMEFDEAFLDNGATFSGVLVIDGLTQDQVRDKELEFKDKYAGANNAGKILWIGRQGGGAGVIDYKQTMATSPEMQTMEKREWNRDTILALRGVPKSEVGLDQGATMITGQGAQSRNVSYWVNSLLPWMEFFSNSLYSQLFKAIDPTLWMDWDKTKIVALQANLGEQVKTARGLLDIGRTMNEAAKVTGIPVEEIEDGLGDVRFLPMGLTPLDVALEPPMDPNANPDNATPSAEDAQAVSDEPADVAKAAKRAKLMLEAAKR